MSTRYANISQFHHNKDSKSFTADKSDIGILAAHPTPYNLVINNPDRLTSAEFGLSRRQDDPEGDHLWWEYAPTDLTLIKYPKLRGYLVTLYND